MNPRTACLATLGLLVALLGCTPKQAPVAPTPVPQSTPLTERPPAVPSVNPQDAAWGQVVEAAKKEGKVTVYGSAFVADIGRRMAQDFQRQYGVQLEILSGGGNVMVEKIKVERKVGQPVGDILQSSTGSVVTLIKAGLAESYAASLPALRDKTPFLIDPVFSPGGDAVSYTEELVGPVINTKLMKAEDEPRSYYDLLNPKWKGGILSVDPRSTGGAIPFFFTPRFHKAVDLDYFSRLAKQDLKVWGGASREAVNMIARGEFSVFLVTNDAYVASLIAEGAPVKLAVLKEGTTVGTQIIAIAKNAPHPNAARLFINWLLSPEGQIAYNQPQNSRPFRKDVPDFTPPAGRVSPVKLLPRTWEAEEWSARELDAGTMQRIFGEK